MQAEFPRQILPYLNDPSLLKATQQAARKLAEVKYSRRRLSERFVEVIRQVSNH
jgi:hypothetical protein